MAGSPLKRARKQGIRLDDGSVVAFPRMPRVADLPKDWRHWSPARKVEHLLGMRLERAAQILCWPPLSSDPLRLSLWFQVWHITWKIGMKAMLDGTLERELARERDRQRLVDELGRQCEKFGRKSRALQPEGAAPPAHSRYGEIPGAAGGWGLISGSNSTATTTPMRKGSIGPRSLAGNGRSDHLSKSC